MSGYDVLWPAINSVVVAGGNNHELQAKRVFDGTQVRFCLQDYGSGQNVPAGWAAIYPVDGYLYIDQPSESSAQIYTVQYVSGQTNKFNLMVGTSATTCLGHYDAQDRMYHTNLINGEVYHQYSWVFRLVNGIMQPVQIIGYGIPSAGGPLLTCNFFGDPGWYHQGHCSTATVNQGKWVFPRIVAPNAYMTRISASGYATDKVACCKGQQAGGVDTTICEDQGISVYDSVACDNVFVAHCSSNNRFGNPECKDWCQLSSNLCDNIGIPYCAAKSVADAIADPICGCFMSSAFYINYYQSLFSELPGTQGILPQLPSCTYPHCSNSVLKNDSRKLGNEPACPNVQVCLQNINVTNLGTISALTIQQKIECGMNINTDTNTATSTNTTTTTVTSTDTGTTTDTATTDDALSQLVLIGIILIATVALLIVVMLFSGGGQVATATKMVPHQPQQARKIAK